MTFEKKMLSDLGQIVTGKTPSTKNSQFWDGEIPFVTPKDIQATKHIIQTERNITEQGLINVKGSTLPAGSICVSCIGNIGYVGITTKRCVSNQQINSVIVNNENDRDFVYYLIKNLWAYFKNYEGQSTALSILNKTQFSKIKVDAPLLNEQKRIAGILSRIDEKIELNNAINNNLQQQIQTLFTSWICHYDPFGGSAPSDWSFHYLSDMADFVGGYAYKGNELTNSTTAMVTIKNFDRRGGFKLDGFKEIKPSEKLKSSQKVNLFDILVAHTDLTQNAEVIGNAEMVLSLSKYKAAIFSMDLVKVIPKHGISKFLLTAILQNNLFKAHCLGYINGTTVLHLSKKALPEYKILLPNDISVLQPLDYAITALYLEISSITEENSNLEILRNTLLPKLMSGDIDVSKVNI